MRAPRMIAVGFVCVSAFAVQAGNLGEMTGTRPVISPPLVNK